MNRAGSSSAAGVTREFIGMDSPTALRAGSEGLVLGRHSDVSDRAGTVAHFMATTTTTTGGTERGSSSTLEPDAFGGEGFILQKLQGDGMVFVHAGGTVIKRELRGERVRVDTGCLVAFTEGIQYEIVRVPGLKSMFFGGEGIFLVSLQGTGTVWLQSLPFSRMCDRILANARSQGGTAGEGSMLTGQLGNRIDGDGVGGGLGGLGGLVSALGRM